MNTSLRHWVGAGLVLSCLTAIPAQAQSSTYTTLNTATGEHSCETLAASDPDEGGEWANVRCAGPGGTHIYIDYADARDALRIGKDGSGTPFMAPFTSFGPKAEWRIRNGKPYAMIVRMTLGGSDIYDAQWLTVHRVPADGKGCLIGYIDARANPGANTMARKLANEHGQLECNSIKTVIRGKRGTAMKDLLGDLPFD